MFDNYIIGENSVRNVAEGGDVIGFSFDTRIAYYRGLGLSMVEPYTIRIDGGDPIVSDHLRFTLGGRTWTFEEMAADGYTRWELLDTATITALTRGGLTTGRHTIEAIQQLRISYLPFLSQTRFTRSVTVD